MSAYRVVRLMKNHLYPTFQLYAEMKNKKTAPTDGLKLAALITMEWLRLRLGDDVPEELKNVPSPEHYLSCSDEQLASFHLNAGFMIDIVSAPKQGVWTLQITEPDLGPDPGAPDQNRQAVPGRVIETNVAFRAAASRVECGFKTLISDPEGTEQEAEVYRLAIVRRLASHPDFGLKQLAELSEECIGIDTKEQLRQVYELTRNKDNMLPTVVFTQILKEKQQSEPAPQLDLGMLFPPDGKTGIPPMMLDKLQKEKSRKPEDPNYEIERFAKYGIGLCRTYLLPESMRAGFQKQIGRKLEAGDTVVLEPRCFGGGVHIMPYNYSSSGRKQDYERLRTGIYAYPRGKTMTFGNLSFLSAARESILEETRELRTAAGEASEQMEQKLAEHTQQCQLQLQEKEAECHALREQLRRQQEYQERLEREKQELRENAEETRRSCQLKLHEKDEEIAYLRRKMSQPKEHEQISAWVKKYFSKRLILHPKAEILLEDKSCRAVDVGLICDALDFLATDYWERRYNHLSTDDMNLRCGEKYGRPFDVSPIGTTTIEYTPSQYKIKYFPGRAGKPVESPLDFHLGVGNDPENLLRIYFLHDDEKKLIVVGSLPKHLRAVTIR